MRPHTIRLARATAAFVALPGVVAFLVPLLIAAPAIRAGDVSWLRGLLPLAAGIVLLIWCVRAFFTLGQGTLAPWDPPRRLVTTGPYAVSRNPMYVAVTLILLGWTLAFGSKTLLVYSLVAMLVFHLRVRLGEEPWLRSTYHEVWTRYAQRVPRWIFRSRRGLALSWVAAFALLLFAGLVYEAYADASAAREYPAPGMLVDVGGGRHLHLLCIGNGTPTVLFEPSGWGNATSAARARERISTRTRVCSYDRMGTGWSDVGPDSVTFADLARDVALLEDRGKLGSPLVIVAASVGGLTAEAFARQYPERIAGLVLLDAATSDLLSTMSGRLGTGKMAACAAGTAARFGVIRVVDPFGLGAEHSDEARRSAAITYGARPWATLCALFRGTATKPDVIATLPPLRPDLPLVVLSASSQEGLFPGSQWLADVGPQLIASHQQFAKRSTRGTWKVVPKSTHLIAGSQPDAVADTVMGLIKEIE